MVGDAALRLTRGTARPPLSVAADDELELISGLPFRNVLATSTSVYYLAQQPRAATVELGVARRADDSLTFLPETLASLPAGTVRALRSVDHDHDGKPELVLGLAGNVFALRDDGRVSILDESARSRRTRRARRPHRRRHPGPRRAPRRRREPVERAPVRHVRPGDLRRRRRQPRPHGRDRARSHRPRGSTLSLYEH